MNPQWEGGLELNFGNNSEDGTDHEVDGRYDDTGGAGEEGPKDYISDARESSLWTSLRDCLTPAEVLVLRTGGPKWYNAKLYGEFAELWFFLMKGKGGEEPPFAPVPEWPSLCFFIVRISSSIIGMFEPGWLPDLTAFEDSGVWT